jgi:hypothetical protein
MGTGITVPIGFGGTEYLSETTEKVRFSMKRKSDMGTGLLSGLVFGRPPAHVRFSNDKHFFTTFYIANNE